ncbi:DoxX family protein [Undibacter mobilis]|uniref:DoxX family protein n=1 Tax=Undibacter mobilis TaxID=2292256 RepID=A0A371B2U3_9BRAD|nr:DoxX family protein [Undibacter mobilis]RDV01827.1 DoxX family protein [Undibacter mobilis]
MLTRNNETRLLIPGLSGFYAAMEPIAYTLVRVVLGLVLFMHGWQKVNTFGLDKVSTAFATNYGLPGASAYLVAFVELIGGAAILIGLFTRFFASASAILLLVAMFAAHWAKGFYAGQGGYEFALTLGIVAFFIAIRGGGRYSVDAKIGKEL